MSTINYTYNVIVDRFRQFSEGHFQLRRFTHGEISQADLEKEAEWPWMHVKPRAINYSPGTRAFSFEIFISDLPRDKEDKTGYQAESITDCSLIFQDLINEIHLGHMFGDDVLLTRPVNSEPFVEQYTHTLTGITGTIELSLDYDWSACSIPASWNYNTPTNSPSDGFGALQFIESLDQNGVFVSLDNDLEAPGNSYYYGTNGSGVKGWYASQAGAGTVTSIDLTAGTGISVSGGPITSSGSITVTNSAPDQVVALTAGTGITTSGTYPNFTITNSAPSSGGTVTSVAALTLGTSGADLSSTVANGTTTPVITLNVPTASAANRGALSAADWSTFNGKQAALGFTAENTANKQNSLAVDGTGVKFPTVDAVNSLSMIDRGKRMLSFFTDFLGTATTFDGLQQSNIGGTFSFGAGGAIPQRTNQQGVVNLTTQVSATGLAYHVSGAVQLYFGNGIWNFESSINLGNLSTILERYRTIHGFGSGGTSFAEPNGAFFTYDEGGTLNGTAASPNWQCVTSANSVRTLTTTTTAVTAATWHKLRIEIDSAGTSVAFYLNGTLLATHTTNIPLGSASRYVIVKQGINKTIGITPTIMYVDYLGYENIQTTPRT